MTVDSLTKPPRLSHVFGYDAMINITKEFSRLKDGIPRYDVNVRNRSKIKSCEGSTIDLSNQDLNMKMFGTFYNEVTHPPSALAHSNKFYSPVFADDYSYMDNAGAALYPQSLIKRTSSGLIDNMYMNPHSDPHSHEAIEDVRRMVLRHFNTDLSTYSVIFTSGATQSLKLVIESFRFKSSDETNLGAFAYLCDNHTSILGLRELVKIQNVNMHYISHEGFLNAVTSPSEIGKSGEETLDAKANVLVAYPAQNNFNGFKYPISCIDEIKNGSLSKHMDMNDSKHYYNWFVLLDVASFVSTSSLDLSVIQPDFISLSFYKIFGYPTGLGALLVKNSSVNVLDQKLYYGGGTVDTVLNTDGFFARKEDVHERFEDGTISFLSIMALKHCFDVLNELVPSVINNNLMATISEHTYYLAKDLYDKLKELKHTNGGKVIKFYMDSDFTDIKRQGGIVTFNIRKRNGDYVGYNEFQHKAEIFKIGIRTGCFCNSGSCQRHFKLTNKEIIDRYKAGHKCGGATDLIDGVPTGAIRASFGYYNTFKDVNKIIDVITTCYIEERTLSTNHELLTSKTKEHEMPTEKNTLPCRKYVKEENYFDLTSSKPSMTLKEILIYPIEFCGPFKIHSNWNICANGLEYNRQWKIINKTGTPLTQKHKSLMSKIMPEIDLNTKSMILRMEGKNSISVPLDSCDIKCNANEDNISEYDYGDEVADWISEAINNTNSRLVRISTVETSLITNRNREDSFNNQNMMLLLNMETLELSNRYISDSFWPINDIAQSVQGNIVVDIPHELFTRICQVIVIGNHEFKVEGILTQSFQIQSTVKSPKQYSKEHVVGVYLTYIKSFHDCDDTLKVNSRIVIPIVKDTNYIQKYKEIKEDKILPSKHKYFKDVANSSARKIKYFFRKKEKYELYIK